MAEVSTIPAYVLANENLLMWMINNPLISDYELAHRNILRELAYVDFHRWNDKRPDHVFRHRWERFQEEYAQGKRYLVGQVSRKIEAIEKNNAKHKSLVLATLECLVDEYIEPRDGELHIKLEKFGWWQNMLSRVSSLPVQAYASVKYNMAQGQTGRDRHYKYILYPHDKAVETYINLNGLNDSHVHANLCAYMEECWLYALSHTDRELDEQKRIYNENELVVSLYSEIHVHLTPQVMCEHLCIAKKLRYLLVNFAYDQKIRLKTNHQCNKVRNSVKRTSKLGYVEMSPEERLTELGKIPPSLWGESHVMSKQGEPEKMHPGYDPESPDVIYEQDWMERVFKKLMLSNSVLVDRALHLYILIMNEYYTFCVQRDNFVGFKQFQKYSAAKRLFLSSSSYFLRVFERMHGVYKDSQTNYLELRIAPKMRLDDMEKSFRTILAGYAQYACNHHTNEQIVPPVEDMDSILNSLDDILNVPHRLVKLAIVPHLIKRPWIHKPREKSESAYRYGKQREGYENVLNTLKVLFDKYPKIRRWIRGIDAAADEMDTPPDVFAPAFRQARNSLQLQHCTYHAGEDFYHLIGGIRVVCEAVDMLHLKNGDRIGHATSLGVDPQLWMYTMPGLVSPTHGEWLQDIVFAWDMLKGQHEMQELVQKLEYDIREAGYIIFCKHDLSPHVLKRVFDLRNLDPKTLLNVYNKAKNRLNQCKLKPKMPSMAEISDYVIKQKKLAESEDVEERLVYEAFCNEAPETMQLIIDWQSNGCIWRRSERRIEVPTDYLSCDELISLQQLAMKKLSQKNIIIETLPSSNLRISQYKEMGQHHSLRWLGISPCEGDCAPPVVLGSDDPGIFSTDIKAEFYHLFTAMCKAGWNSQQALERLIKMNECGSSYAFRSLANNDVEVT